MKYSVVTFGCRVNQADSLAIESELYGRGAEASRAEHADLVIVNTCSVTASADQGSRQTIRRIARENPAARIVVTGCYATRCADEIAELPGVAAVLPNEQKGAPSFVATLMRRDAADSAEGPCGRLIVPGLMGRTAWTLRVQTGCEESCSYCIIPTTRGASRSRTVEDVQSEVSRVRAAGYREIVLTGVHLGSYGRDLRPRASLSDLLAALSHEGAADAEPLVLFRLSSLEPMDCTREVIELICHGAPGHPSVRFAPHLHLPLQHASDRVLALMQRPYDLAFYSSLVSEIRQRLPHASIGSDVMAGFPGETDADFARLVAYLESSPLTHLHVFPYSDRPGTVASALAGKVHGSVTKARAQRLREISRVLSERFRASQRGTLRPALTIDDGTVAVTDNYLRVNLPAPHQRNEWVTVTV
jgi:threonylcarbamoyladenosine tRNA methylthiotransferase MtaB